MNNTCICFYHGCNWSDIPVRQQYLMRALSHHIPVVFFDGGTDRLWQVSIQQPEPNVTVVRGLTAVCQRFQQRGLGAVASAYAAWHLRKVRRKYGRVVFWAGENWLRPYRFIRHDDLIYDCVDPCLSEDPRRIEIFDAREATVARPARLVFASAAVLHEKMLRLNPASFLVENSAGVEDHHPSHTGHLPMPAELHGLRRPIIGYLGAFDSRLDYAAMTALARLLPDCTFALAGRVNRDQEENVKELRSLPNVSMPGQISYEAGKAFVAALDVGLIPFRPGPIGDAINPTKMWCYLMAGKPVVSTAIRESLRYPGFVHAGATPQDMAAMVRKALAETGEPFISARLKFSLENTYDCRCDEVLTRMRQTGLLDRERDTHASAA